MRRTTLLMTLLTVVLLGYSDKGLRLTEGNLKGRVKSVIKSHYRAVEKFGEIQKDAFAGKDVYKYDDSGNMIEESKYDADGSLSTDITSTYKYDDNGNMIEESRYKADDSLLRKYKYDDNGNKIEWSRYDADGFLYIKKTYHQYDEYDKQGNWLRQLYSSGVDSSSRVSYITEREIAYY